MEFANQLELSRCPHCQVHTPHLACVHETETTDHSGGNHRVWKFYACRSCGGIVTAYAGYHHQDYTFEWFPESASAADTIPDRARAFLDQAIESLHAPAGSIMLCASSVDAMLKEKGYASGTLNSRIKKAVDDHLVTPEMAEWAHEVRLDANDQRHADDNGGMPTGEDARKCVDFVAALGEFLFVLPARIERGRRHAR